MGDISLLQGYFRLHNREDEASWDYIVKIGLQCVLDELEMRNWPTACQMLKNMVRCRLVYTGTMIINNVDLRHIGTALNQLCRD